MKKFKGIITFFLISFLILSNFFIFNKSSIKRIEASEGNKSLISDEDFAELIQINNISDEEENLQIEKAREEGLIKPPLTENNINFNVAAVDGIYNEEILDVPYINQCWEPNGTFYPNNEINGGWIACKVMCGAAAAVMAAGYHKVLPYTGETDYEYKKFMYKPNVDSRFTKSCSEMSTGWGGSYYDNTSGAFSITGKDVGCHQNSKDNIKDYLAQVGLETHDMAMNMESVINAISGRGNPILANIKWFPSGGHFVIIKGYNKEKNQVILSDSSYSYNGDGVRVDFSDPTNIKLRESIGRSFRFNSMFEINRKEDTDKVDVKTYEEKANLRGSKSFMTEAYTPKSYHGYGTISWNFSDNLSLGSNEYEVNYYKGGGFYGKKDIKISRHKYADINGDEKIDFLDMSIMAKNWGKEEPKDYMVNLNSEEDNVVDIKDLSIMASRWGR